ncbi:hypothetical protein [Streptomyces indicus]|uniref:Phage-related protein n=1 Tax=Streptomyces indicus TaxID=417292 RepID=A0A1G9IRH3_9ACTN|nr:hypothetical protein [Streptomyces indicus]SDL27626.1 Phage-related protein [Streptomyces indicus]
MAAISVGSVEVDVIPNTRGIRSQLQASLVPAANQVGDEIGRIIGRHVSTQIAQAVRNGVATGGRTATPQAARSGEQAGGAFGRTFRSRVQAAMQNLPRADVRIDETGFNADMARLRARLETLSNKRIGVDVDAGTALAEVERLQQQLRRLGAEHPDVNVRVDTGQAIAELEALRAEINRLDGRTAKVDVDTRSAAANLRLLSTAAITFGPALIPVLPVVAAGLGAIAAAASAAAVGIGSIALVGIPAFVQMGKVMQAQKAAQDASTNATLRGSQAAAQGASKALQMASAQQALAAAERNGARQIAQAQRAVGQAKQAAADAVAQAAQRNAEAARRVQDAERSLADAQRDARRAQEDLSDARKQAALELEDLNSRLANSVLSQRDAEIALKEATAQRDAVLNNANASGLDREKALLAYDQAVQRLKDQTTETKRLKTETTKANKAGVEGSDTVRNAQERLAEAQQNVADRAQAVKDAQAEAARTQVETARQVAEAQQRVSEATENVAVAQQNAADAVASAQRQIEQASLSAAGGVDQAAIAQAKYEAELAKLTPSARETFEAFLDLRDAFSAWSRSLQPAVMPIFTRALEGLKNSLPGLTPFVLAAADAIGDLQDRASRGFKSPWWKEFKADLEGSVQPALIGLGVSFGNVFKGMAGILQAFFPHMDSISQRMQDITGRFASWGSSLKGSPEFERFLSYSAEHAPLLAETFGDIAGAFLDIGEALSPVSGPLLEVLGAMAQGVSSLATNVPELVIALWGLWAITRLWGLAMLIVNGALAAFNLISMAGPWGWIVLAIAAVVLGVIYLYRRFEWFRDGVQAVWTAIQDAAMWLWTNALQPAFGAISGALRAIGDWAMWLWTNAIKPAWDAIVLAGQILATTIVTLVFLPIYAVILLVGGIVTWLWENAIRPTFNAIADLAMWLWTNAINPAFTWIGDKALWLWNSAIKPAWRGIQEGAKWMWENVLRPVFRAFMDGLRELGRWGTWLWKNAIKPAWDGIVSAGKWAWDHGIRPIFNTVKDAVKAVGTAFGRAKDAIKTAWDKLIGIAKKPVEFVVNTVYNNGIRKVWNLVAGAFGAPKLDKVTFARGGIMPGYTPGRDVHKFVSPTGGALELSGGEAIMRPEFTRAVGSGFVGSMNQLARSGGTKRIRETLAPILGGNPRTPTDRSLRYARGGTFPVQSFADGGVFGWIKSAGAAVAGAGSAAWNKVKQAASWLKDTMEASARAGVENVVDPILKRFPGMDTGFGKMLRRIPTRIIDALFGYTKEADKRGAGGVGGPKIQKALNWAKTQHGKPYQWAGNGNPSWDCSGFMSAIESVIRGQKPHRRWATMAFRGKTAPPGWVRNGKSAFQIGITNAGVGHTAGTLGKTNVESRGGDGVVVGKKARGAMSAMFTDVYGFMPGKYDNGGMLQPGFNLAYNGTGRPEPVLTGRQWNNISTAANSGAHGGEFTGNLYLDSGEFLGVVRGELRERDRLLIEAVSARRYP